MRDRPRPRTVHVAFWLWAAAAVLALVTAGVGAARYDALHDGFTREARAEDPSAGQDTVEQVADLSVLVIVGGGLLLGVLGVLLAAAMRAGRKWARFALVLVAVMAVAYAVLVTGPTGWLPAACAVVAVTGAICAYLPGSRSWYV